MTFSVRQNHFKDFFRSGSNLNHFVYSVYSHFPTLPYVMDEKKVRKFPDVKYTQIYL